MKTSLSFIITFFFFFSLGLNNVQAYEQAPMAQISTQVDKALLIPGETVTFKIEIQHQPQVQFQIPEIGDQIYGLRILDFGQEGPKEIDQSFYFTKWYKMVADQNGSYILPSLTISFRDAKGKSLQLKTSEIFLKVETPVAVTSTAPVTKQSTEKMAQLQDIHDIKSLPPRLDKLRLFLLLTCVMTILAAVIFFLTYRKKMKKEKVSVVIDTRPSYDKALANTRQLDTDFPHIQGYEKLVYFRFSEIVRTFLQDHFQIPSLEKTFEEIKPSLLQQYSLQNEEKTVLLNLLRDCDDFKFADRHTLQEEHRSRIQRWIHYLEKIKEKEESSVIPPSSVEGQKIKKEKERV
jgi:hypothetical protein